MPENIILITKLENLVGCKYVKTSYKKKIRVPTIIRDV